VVEHVTSDGIRIAVDIAGPDDARTVVLVHGLAASVDLGWRAFGVLDRLTAAGLRTVAYDGRGHGCSDAPTDPARYGDARLVADLHEIVDRFASPDAVLVGYSMGAAVVLLALADGMPARGAVVGATPRAVLEWTADDAEQIATAVAVLEGRTEPDDALQGWLEFLDATGCSRAALAALLRGHRPVIEAWDRIMKPVVVAAGGDDVAAALPATIAARLVDARVLALAGDHITAAGDPALTEAIVTLARG
jgi:pimeloyl-ACP methyl ester carboxylesterase